MAIKYTQIVFIVGITIIEVRQPLTFHNEVC